MPRLRSSGWTREPPMKLVDHELNWHDGNLIDIRLNGFIGERADLTLTVELYAGETPPDVRRAFRCVGADLKRFLVTGDVARLIKNRNAGNVDYMRMDFTEDTEILMVSLFGGTIEAEASFFELTEAEQ
jgi:hypothetical protein